MPSFDVSSVDTTANTLTATGVAAAGGPLGTVLTTGDRMRLRNVGGALPAATPSLAPVTDFFAIRIDDNTVKVATSNADAMAGTAVDITGSGSGTTKIEFGLPYCLPTLLAAPGVQVQSFVMLFVWSALVALWNLLTGQAESVWGGNVTLAGTLTVPTISGPVSILGGVSFPDTEIYSVGLAVPGSGVTLSPGGFSGSQTATLALGTSTNPSNLPIRAKLGATLSAWSVRLFKASASGTITAKLWRADNTLLTCTQVGANQSNNANAPGMITLGQSGLTEVVGASGNSYFIELIGGGVTGDNVADWKVTTT
jgi:hypothetical protein